MIMTRAVSAYGEYVREQVKWRDESEKSYRVLSDLDSKEQDLLFLDGDEYFALQEEIENQREKAYQSIRMCERRLIEQRINSPVLESLHQLLTEYPRDLPPIPSARMIKIIILFYFGIGVKTTEQVTQIPLDKKDGVQPPKNATFMLWMFIRSPKQRERISNALEEDYRRALDEFGSRHARFFYQWAVSREVVYSIANGIKKWKVFSAIIEIGKMFTGAK